MNKSKEQISYNMKQIKNKDTKIEIILRKALWKKGIRYRKNYNKIPGKPDIAITKYKIAIFCDSEFFHGKDWEQLQMQIKRGRNPDFWVEKISRNRERDSEVDMQLRALDWEVIRFWGRDITKKVDECVRVVEEKIFDLSATDTMYDDNLL